jgi:hypothetical protein
MEDIRRLVDMGARHITFGDPDFLNGVHHSLRIVRAMHELFAGLTFDVTTKVELILRHEGIWAEMAEAGCLFVVTAFETFNDTILARLDKGHTRADALRSLALLRAHHIEVRPSFLPFTPWTDIGDLVDIFNLITENDLAESVDPVQLTLRLLVPEGSLLLDQPDIWPYLGDYDPERLTYRWRAADPEVDRVQERMAEAVTQGVALGEEPSVTMDRLRDIVTSASGRELALTRTSPTASVGRPRLTEPWFC